MPKGLDWAISPPPAAPQDGGGLDPECRNDRKDEVPRKETQKIKTCERTKKASKTNEMLLVQNIKPPQFLHPECMYYVKYYFTDWQSVNLSGTHIITLRNLKYISSLLLDIYLNLYPLLRCTGYYCTLYLYSEIKIKDIKQINAMKNTLSQFLVSKYPLTRSKCQRQRN